MKKLLVFLLVICMLSLALLASCGSSSKKGSKDDDDDSGNKTVQTNAPTTSKGATITKEEWAGMLGATNVTVSYPIPAAGAIATYSLYNGSSSFKISNQEQTYYYTTKNGEFYCLTVVDNKVQTLEKNSSAMATLLDVCFFNALTVDDYENLSYNEETQTYSISKGYTYSFEFTFVDGVIATAVANGTNYTFTNYGSTKVSVPSFKVNSNSSSSDGTVSTGNGTTNTGNSTVNTGNSTVNTGNGNTSDSNGSTGDSDWNEDFEPSTGSTIIYEEWVRMLRADNFYAQQSIGGYYQVADGAIVSPDSIIAKHNGHIYIFTRFSSDDDWERAPITDAYGDINLNWLFFAGQATDDDYYSLAYDKENECYTYGKYFLYFRDGYLYRIDLGSIATTVENYGKMSNSLPALPFPDSGNGETDNSGYYPEDSYPDDPWYDDDEISTKITYEDWVYNITLKNYVFADSQTGIVYKVTENVYARESIYDLTQVYIVDGDYVYIYIMDANGDFQYSDTWDASEADAPTLGELIGYVNPDIYYDLYYDEDEGCYYYEGYRFEFENGLLVEFDYLKYISNHGTTVIEEMPELEKDDEEVRTEITYDEWCALFGQNNYTVTYNDGMTIYYTDGAYMLHDISGNIAYMVLYGDYYYEMVPNGDSYVITATIPWEDVQPPTLGALVLGENYSDYYNFEYLSYDSYGAYSFLGFSMYFENGLLVNFDNILSVTDHYSTTIEGLSDVYDFLYSEVSNGSEVPDESPLSYDDWEALCQLDNYSIVLGDTYYYINGNVCMTVQYDTVTYSIFEDGMLYIYYVNEYGNRYLYWSTGSANYDSFSIGEFMIRNLVGVHYADLYYFLTYDSSLGCYTYDDALLYISGDTVTIINSYYNCVLSSFGTTDIGELPPIEGEDEGGTETPDVSFELTYDEWVNMLYMNNFTATADGQDMYFDNGKLFGYFDGLGDTYMFEDGYGNIYAIINYYGSYYAAVSDYGSVNLSKYVLSDTVNEYDYYSLEYDSYSDCYVLEVYYYGIYLDYMFYFENGIIQQIEISVDGESSYCIISEVGSTVVTLPDFTYVG